jgi:fructose-bisphosphate aldolase class 1
MGKGKQRVLRSADHSHNLFEKVAKMAQESGMPADCLVEKALDDLAKSDSYKNLVLAHAKWRGVVTKGAKKTG